CSLVTRRPSGLSAARPRRIPLPLGPAPRCCHEATPRYSLPCPTLAWAAARCSLDRLGTLYWKWAVCLLPRGNHGQFMDDAVGLTAVAQHSSSQRIFCLESRLAPRVGPCAIRTEPSFSGRICQRTVG